MSRESVESIFYVYFLKAQTVYQDQELNISGFFLFFVFSEDYKASLYNNK